MQRLVQENEVILNLLQEPMSADPNDDIRNSLILPNFYKASLFYTSSFFLVLPCPVCVHCLLLSSSVATGCPGYNACQLGQRCERAALSFTLQGVLPWRQTKQALPTNSSYVAV